MGTGGGLATPVRRANHLWVTARRSDAAAFKGGGGALSVRRHPSTMLPIGASSDSIPDWGGGLRARCMAHPKNLLFTCE